LVAVVLITTIVVSLNIEMSLENRIRQELIADISENSNQCKAYSLMEDCIEGLVNQRLGR
jgi:ribosomal protein S3AE